MTALDPQRRVIAVANGKGGTGKTSVSSGLAGELAGADLRVLAVDLDPLGGLARDFGVTARGTSDDGMGLVRALIDDDHPPLPRQEVRPNLDLVTGGVKLEILVAYASTQGDTEWLQDAGAQIGKLAEDEYDFVIIDTPPGDAVLQRLAMYAARWLIIPVRTDMGSWDGLRTMGRRVRTCRQINVELDYLGAVIFGNPIQATGLLARTQSQLGQEIGESFHCSTQASGTAPPPSTRAIADSSRPSSPETPTSAAPPECDGSERDEKTSTLPNLMTPDFPKRLVDWPTTIAN